MSITPGTSTGIPSAEPVPDEALAPSPCVARTQILQAQALLLELTGCPADCAADALHRVAACLGVPVQTVAQRLLHDAASSGHDSGSFVARVERTALAGALQRRRRADAPPPPPASAGPLVSGDLRGVTVSGEIDLATSWLLDRAASEACPPFSGTGTRPVFLLDLTGVTFLDACALHALTEAQARAEANGYDVRVAAPTAAGPRRVLHLAVDQDWLDPIYRPPADEPLDQPDG